MNDRIWIWGVADAGKFATRYLEENGYTIAGLIDNSEAFAKYTFFCCGYQIYSYHAVKEFIKKEDFVLCCCSLNNYDAIRKILNGDGHSNYKHFYDMDFSEAAYKCSDMRKSEYGVSKLCSEADFFNENFIRVADLFSSAWNGVKHRKLWEFVYIINVLEEHNCIKAGRRGIGFATGQEPLPSYFASRGVRIRASDLAPSSENAKKWLQTGQNSNGNKESLWWKSLCDKDSFDALVSYRNIDMNHIPLDEVDYDFCWSSCAIEHVGSMELSKSFLKNMLGVLKSGGVAVHTTEFNLSSNNDTIKTGDSVIFRRRDIEEMKEWFENNGHLMEVSFDRERTEGNSYIDIAPYTSEYKPYHLSLVANGFVETSFAIVVIKDGLRINA